jgi:hypothetical protein
MTHAITTNAPIFFLMADRKNPKKNPKYPETKNRLL